MIIHISTHILLRKAIALVTSGPEGMLVPHAHKAWHFYKTLKHVLSHNTTIPVFLVSSFADFSFFVAAHFYKYLSVKTVLLITESSLFKVKMKRICLLSLQREYSLVLDAFFGDNGNLEWLYKSLCWPVSLICFSNSWIAVKICKKKYSHFPSSVLYNYHLQNKYILARPRWIFCSK